MFKYKAVTFILLMAFFTAQAYCQKEEQQLKTIAGTVTYVDTAGSVVGVQTKKGMMVFHISVESDLLRYAHHMASVEIVKGDPVIIQYESTSLGKNIIIRLVDKQPDSF